MRGVTANIAIMEEGSHMNERVLYEVFAPLIGVEKFAILGISTPDSEDNYYSKLMTVQGPGGEPIFRAIHLQTVCADCMKAGLEDKCTHGTTELPSWKSKKRQKLLEALYSTSSETRLLGARETAGTIVTGKKLVFERSWIEKLDARPPHSFIDNRPPDFLYTSIDPAGGGEHSEYAIVTTAFQGSKNVIVGCDSTPSGKNDVIITMIRGHFERIRANSMYERSLIVVMIERNYGGEPVVTHLIEQINMLQTIHPIVFQDRIQRRSREVGVWMTDTLKLEYVEQLKIALADNAIHFASEFVSENEQRARAMITEQLGGFAHKIKLPTDEFGKAKSVFTGKGHGGKDDLVICLSCCIWWMAFKRHRDNAFIEQARRRGMLLD